MKNDAFDEYASYINCEMRYGSITFIKSARSTNKPLGSLQGPTGLE